MAVVRKHIIFRGWVQGVGFRWRAMQAARACGATGWVKNEYDGSVVMEIQGTDEQIDSVILAIERGSYVRIEDLEIRELPLVDDERGFHAY